MKEIEAGQLINVCCRAFDEVGLDTMQIVANAILQKECKPLINDEIKYRELDHEGRGLKTLNADIGHFIDMFVCCLDVTNINEIKRDIESVFRAYECNNDNDDCRERRNAG